VKIAVLGSESDAGIYLADEMGFFAAQGLRIQYEQLGTASEMVPLLSTGQIDVSGPAINAATLNALARGVEIKLVADKGSVWSRANSFTSFVLRKDLADSGTVRDFSDLRGRVVGITPPRDGTSNAVDLARGLATAGLTPDDVTVVNLPYQDMNAALASRSIDAAIEFEPLITRGIADGILIFWKPMADLYPYRQYTVVAYSPTLARERPAVANGFMVAYLQGVRVYNDAFVKGIDKAAAINRLVKYTNLKDPALYDRITPPGLNPNGVIGLDNVLDDHRWFVEHGQVQGDVDLARFVDNQYVDYALQQLGRYQP
jgi:ABC-type nitrate/sulfonate/bicarbonate transport system substrate-binding protein